MKYLFGDKVERLISLQVALSLFVVLLVIGFLDLFFQLLNEFQDVDEKYSLADAMLYSFSSMPFRLYDLSPYFCLIGMVLGLGSLSDHGELIGARALGKSYVSIGLAAFRPLFIVIALGLVASEYYIPDVSQSAIEGKAEKKETLDLNQGYWMKRPEGILFFQSAPNKETIKGIKLIQMDKNQNPISLIKSELAFVEEDYWVLSDPSIQRIGLEEMNSNLEKGITITKGTSGIKTVLSPKYLSLTDLEYQISTADGGFRKRSLSLEFWKKILQPILTISLLLLSLGFIFGPMRDQKSSQRILISLLIAFCFDLSQKLLGSASVVFDTPAVISIIIPALIVSTIGILNLRKLN